VTFLQSFRNEFARRRYQQRARRKVSEQAAVIGR
jgi:hypothetical protein